MGQYRDRMIEEMSLRGYASGTQELYVYGARAFVKHFMKPPPRISAEQARSYFVAMANRLAAGTYRVRLASVKFLYRHVVGKPEVVEGIPYLKQSKPLPVILAATEIRKLANATNKAKYRVALLTCYGAGLRVNEVCSLQVGDIDSRRKVIHVRQGKGRKDRYTILSNVVLQELRQYWAAQRPAEPHLFPGERHKGRPMPVRTFRKAIRQAARACGLRKHVTPHVLRHTFATHMLTMGADIRQIQLLLGHKSIQTTQRYLQMSKRHIAVLGSPLDAFGTEEAAILG